MVIDILFFLFAGDRVWTRFEINPTVEVAATDGWRKYFFLSYRRGIRLVLSWIRDERGGKGREICVTSSRKLKVLAEDEM